jgi:hypothetical protein
MGHSPVRRAAKTARFMATPAGTRMVDGGKSPLRAKPIQMGERIVSSGSSQVYPTGSGPVNSPPTPTPDIP